jgi:putative transcriptional regulator
MENTLKTERIRNEMTQIQLADFVKVSRQTIISIESGRYIPSVLLALKIAKIFNLYVEDLFHVEKSD